MITAMSRVCSQPETAPVPARSKGGWARPRWIGDARRLLGITGDAAGTGGMARRTFIYGFATAAVFVATINIMNVISHSHGLPDSDLFGPVVWESSSWLAAMAFLWIIWIAYRLAPPLARSRWRLLLHIPGTLVFALAHVSAFIALRKLAYALAGSRYVFGSFWTNFAYELRKDMLGYALILMGFAFINHLLRQRPIAIAPNPSFTFDIRDGARLTRVQLNDVLAICSAGNYVEFLLRDGRRLMTRATLSALEQDLNPRGFVRTHRSWLVNAGRVTGLKRQGSGDYTVELDGVTVPLSRRFSQALAQLKSADLTAAC
jgi:hypothetical protein